MTQYRTSLLDAEQRSQSEYDKLVATLSGGALGVSFAFVDRFVNGDVVVNRYYLEAAWLCWVVSLIAILLSHFLLTSPALRSAIRRLDQGTDAASLAGRQDKAVAGLNVTSGIAFVLGAIFAGVCDLERFKEVPPCLRIQSHHARLGNQADSTSKRGFVSRLRRHRSQLPCRLPRKKRKTSEYSPATK